MSSPRTSIIMPVYNTANTVIAAMESVLAQTDPDFELLVVVAGSPAHSSKVRQCAERRRVCSTQPGAG